MELLLLGTAAAEGLPAPFCICETCRAARRRGGRDIRSRSGALIDGCVKIDYAADTVGQMQRAGRDLTQLTSLIFTHAHNDHFMPSELMYRAAGFVPAAGLVPLHVYANQEIISRLQEKLPKPKALKLIFQPPLEPLRPVQTADGTEILPLPADHDAGSLVLRLSRGGKSLFYGHDSGPYPSETLSALSGAPLDIALFDCTYGNTDRSGGHMNSNDVLAMVSRLRDSGAITDRSQLIVTHFSHNSGLLHDDLCALFEPHAIQAAYDNMTICTTE